MPTWYFCCLGGKLFVHALSSRLLQPRFWCVGLHRVCSFAHDPLHWLDCRLHVWYVYVLCVFASNRVFVFSHISYMHTHTHTHTHTRAHTHIYALHNNNSESDKQFCARWRYNSRRSASWLLLRCQGSLRTCCIFAQTTCDPATQELV